MFEWFFQEDPRSDSYRYAVQPKNEEAEALTGGGPVSKKKKKKKDKKAEMDELKQELEMDEHRIPIEELYARLGTNPDTVSVAYISCNTMAFPINQRTNSPGDWF